MRIDEAYRVFQWAMAYAALGGLAIIALYAFAKAVAPHIHDLWHRWFPDGFGRVMMIGGVALATLYGGSKGFWNPVASSGGDDLLTVTGIYTAVSNVVDDTVSPPVTNHIPMVRVEWLGNGGTAETPVSVRASETNEWAEVEKIDPVVNVEGITNILTFAVSTNFSTIAYSYWWFGVDKPAVIVTEEGIEIRAFVVTANSVHIEWACNETEMTHYTIQNKPTTSAQWRTVATVPAEIGKVNRWTKQMFTVDRDMDWRIITEISGGADE